MLRHNVLDEYFNWIYGMMCGTEFSKKGDFRKLFTYLFDTEFTYIIPNDSNREEDGIALRTTFSNDIGEPQAVKYLQGPCSVLEMMVALAIRCEECIMDNPDAGNRSSKWFWSMINGLGLTNMDDDRFDKNTVARKVSTFLSRTYKPNGVGGLFIVKNYPRDLRDVEIWIQMCWYCDDILDY